MCVVWLHHCLFSRTTKTNIFLPHICAYLVIRYRWGNHCMSQWHSFWLKPFHSNSKFLNSCTNLACFVLEVIRARTWSCITDVFHRIFIQWIILQTSRNRFSADFRSANPTSWCDRGTGDIILSVYLRIVRKFIWNIDCTRVNLKVFFKRLG